MSDLMDTAERAAPSADSFCECDGGIGEPRPLVCVPIRGRFESGATYTEFLAQAVTHKELWDSLSKRAQVAPDLLARAAALRRSWQLLVLSDDWCGDSLNTLPYLARLVEQIPQLDLRILPRDTNLDLMDSHLTGTSRSIPVVMALDAASCERGWWGPRPTELQAWVRSQGMTLPKEERYKYVRMWYARDRGRTAIEELLRSLEEHERNDPGEPQAAPPASTPDQP